MTIRDVLRELIAIARVPVDVVKIPSACGAVEMPLTVGSAPKALRRDRMAAAFSLVAIAGDIYKRLSRRRKH